MIELDGRTGEGGGQLVRMACALAAVIGQPIRITNVRGNRGGSKGGGLKAQHVSAIEWLAKATDATVTGLHIGSHTLEFSPKTQPSALKSRSFNITADSPAASTMLIFQAIFPFLLFASGDSDADGKPLPINLEIHGGTNVSFSLSYEYLDQVLLPALEENFEGIHVERELKFRGWSQGKSHHGHVQLKIYPLPLGQPLRIRDSQLSSSSQNNNLTALAVVETIDITVLAPTTLHASLSDALTKDLDELFPNVSVNFRSLEESGSDARIYILLVALSPLITPPADNQDSAPQTRRHRWGRDILTSTPKKPPPKKHKKGSAAAPPSLSENISRKVCKELYGEVFGTTNEGSIGGGIVDEYLQDQLVIFQALAEGLSSFPSSPSDREESVLENRMGDLSIGDGQSKHKGKTLPVELRKDNRKKTQGPFGEGSLHTTTARWVTTELLPGVTWYNNGGVCQGVGMRMGGSEEV
ncbi:RNA 3'-terminal phosphate cyclase [Naviculisporaceae sp. PSN 640]